MQARTRRLCLGVAGLFIALSSTLFAGFAGTEVFIPAVGRVTGAGGSEFYTTVWITNLSTTATVDFQFQFLRTAQANTSPASFNDTLSPGQTKIYENIVESRFGLTGNGAGRIVADGEVYVSSRIYEQPPGTDLGSSKGLFFSGVPASFGLGIGDRASLQGINQGGAQNLRYNFILLEIGGQPTTVHVDLKDANGATLAAKDYLLQPYEHRQLNVTDVFSSISTTNARLESTVTSGAGKVLFAGAQVTNVSQDPTGFEMSFKGSLLGGNGAAGVQSLNGLMGNVTLEAGTNISIATVGNSLRIAYTATNGAGPTAWSLTGNSGTTPGVHFLGTTDNRSLELRVNDVRALRLEPAAGSPNVIGGSPSNSVTDGVIGATTSGGGLTNDRNRVTDNYGTIGGGSRNTVGDSTGTTSDSAHATIGGGFHNEASRESTTVGGGSNNFASGDTATVGGGNSNVASGQYSSITGGDHNIAAGSFATVVGGQRNIASGNYSFAGGRSSRAIHQGAFVWGDLTDADVISTVANQFLVRANGGAAFIRGVAAPTGTSAGLQVEHGGTQGEAAWLYTANSTTGSVIRLLKVPRGSNHFLQCTTFDGFVTSNKCHIDENGSMVSGSDFAEALPAIGKRKSYEPGDVLVASSEREGSVERSSSRYDQRVIGVYSTRPAVLGADKDGETRVDAEDVPVAITGIVPTKVTAENGPIAAGDLLTTSSTPGHAMKATPVVVGGAEIYRAGTVLGKALTSLHGETGVVKVLVMLR
jgi:hypothetical protein